MEQNIKTQQNPSTFSLQEKFYHRDNVNGYDMECHMENLPVEMLEIILEYLGISDLLNCRLMNCRLNEICCKILESKTRDHPFSNFWRKISASPLPPHYLIPPEQYENSIKKFIKLFGPSERERSSGQRRPCPLTSFHIKDLNKFTLIELAEFVLTFGLSMKSLSIDTDNESASKVEHLLRLLLECAPALDHLYIEGNACLKNVNLVVPPNQVCRHCADRNLIPPNGNFLKLKKFEFYPFDFGEYNNFLQQIISRAPLMKELLLRHTAYAFPHSWNLHKFKILKDLKLIHMVKELKLFIDPIRNFSSPPTDFMNGLKVGSFFLNCLFLSDPEKIFKDYIYEALKSSRDSLKVINMYYPELVHINECVQDITCFPNVQKIDLYVEVDLSILNRLGQLCPNTKTLKFHGVNCLVPECFMIIWDKFKKLESLKVTFCLYDKKTTPIEIDIAISGYPASAIKRITKKFKNGASIENATNDEEQMPSILDLKNLRRLELTFAIRKKTRANKQLEKNFDNSFFYKILPQHIRENPTLISFEHITYYSNDRVPFCLDLLLTIGLCCLIYLAPLILYKFMDFLFWAVKS